MTRELDGRFAGEQWGSAEAGPGRRGAEKFEQVCWTVARAVVCRFQYRLWRDGVCDRDGEANWKA